MCGEEGGGKVEAKGISPPPHSNLTLRGIVPYPDPLVRGTDRDPSIIKKKLLCDFFSLKNDVNVPSKSNKEKKDKKIIFG